jgi:hypothetical protein
MQVRIRYNSKHNLGEKPWKLTIDGDTLLVDNVRFNCPTQGFIEDIPGIGIKSQIGCEAQRITMENKMITIE